MGPVIDLDAIKKRAEEATEGPWTWEPNPYTLYAGRSGMAHGLNLLGRLDPDRMGAVNLDFIAHARTDVPALCDEVERLRAALCHAQYCAVCAEGSWHDCEYGREGLALLGLPLAD